MAHMAETRICSRRVGNRLSTRIFLKTSQGHDTPGNCQAHSGGIESLWAVGLSADWQRARSWTRPFGTAPGKFRTRNCLLEVDGSPAEDYRRSLRESHLAGATQSRLNSAKHFAMIRPTYLN